MAARNYGPGQYPQRKQRSDACPLGEMMHFPQAVGKPQTRTEK